MLVEGQLAGPDGAPAFGIEDEDRRSAAKVGQRQTSQIQSVVVAAVSTASALDLRVDDAVVLHDSNRLALRLRPCDVLARVAHMEGQGGAEVEVEVARRRKR
jgi:hypothetical protein